MSYYVPRCLVSWDTGERLTAGAGDPLTHSMCCCLDPLTLSATYFCLEKALLLWVSLVYTEGRAELQMVTKSTFSGIL